VAICYTYRAHWELCNLPTQRDRDRYAPAIAAARDGLALFAEAGAGVSLRALQPEGASSSCFFPGERRKTTGGGWGGGFTV